MIESCKRSCGSVSIPYPFGIGHGCAMDDHFRVDCRNDSHGTLRPFIGDNHQLEILKVDVDAGSVLVKNNVSRLCYDDPAGGRIGSAASDFSSSTDSFLHFSVSANKPVFIGCGSA